MKNSLVTGVAAALAVLGCAIALKYAERIGAVDAETAMRGTMAAIGLMLAFMSNLIPKQAAPAKPRRLAVERVAGWSLTMGGLAYAAAWVFAPRALAADTSMAAVAAAIIVSIVYCAVARPISSN